MKAFGGMTLSAQCHSADRALVDSFGRLWANEIWTFQIGGWRTVGQNSKGVDGGVWHVKDPSELGKPCRSLIRSTPEVLCTRSRHNLSEPRAMLGSFKKDGTPSPSVLCEHVCFSFSPSCCYSILLCVSAYVMHGVNLGEIDFVSGDKRTFLLPLQFLPFLALEVPILVPSSLHLIL